MYVCDVYAVSADGRELLIARKTYNKPGTAKAFRTNMIRRWEVTLDRRARALPRYQYSHFDFLEHRDVPNDLIVDRRYDVYALTPMGYQWVI
jgi:hypothetical protein